MKEQQQLTILKIGGNVLNNPTVLNKVLKAFSSLPERKILIHGGGRKASELMRQMGIEPQMIDGRRITDLATLEVVTMVYAGLINKQIVAALQANSCNAIGLSGADLNAIQSHKRIVKEIDFGWVGDIDKVKKSSLSMLLENQITPVFCAITHDNKGQLLNTNADSIASYVAAAMGKIYRTRLLLCFEKEGVLSNPDDDTSIITNINFKEFQTYKSNGTISAGMIPKMESAFYAIENGVEEVYIAGPNVLATQPIKGTRLCL